MKQTKSQRWYLSERATQADVKVRNLALGGLTGETIAKETGYTIHQVRYRLKILGISAMDYRRGQNFVARALIKAVNEDSKHYFDTIQSNIKKFLKEQ